MAIRARRDFPLFQHAPSGIVWFRSPVEGWYIHQEYEQGKVPALSLQFTALVGREACYKLLRGRTHDITEAEFGQIGRELVRQFNARKQLKILPANLDILLAT